MVDVDVLEGRWARVRARKRPTYRIVGNFRGVLNFVIFVVPYEVTKISTHKFFSVLGTYAHVRLHVRTREIVIAAFAFDMALFCYLRPLDSSPLGQTGSLTSHTRLATSIVRRPRVRGQSS